MCIGWRFLKTEAASLRELAAFLRNPRKTHHPTEPSGNSGELIYKCTLKGPFCSVLYEVLAASAMTATNVKMCYEKNTIRHVFVTKFNKSITTLTRSALRVRCGSAVKFNGPLLGLCYTLTPSFMTIGTVVSPADTQTNTWHQKYNPLHSAHSQLSLLHVGR